MPVILLILGLVINPNAFIVNGTIVLGWLLFAFQLTWNQSEYFYMRVKSIWFIIKNPDCVWNVHVDFNGQFDYDIFEKLDSVFTSQCDQYKIVPLSNTRRLYKINTLTYEVILSPQSIQVQLNDLEISYRRSKTIMEQELGVLLEQLSKVIKEDTSEYFLNINFKEYNPYFGYFIRRLSSREINSFNVTLKLENDKVTVNKESIEIYTSSLQKLQNLSKEYLTLSPR